MKYLNNGVFLLLVVLLSACSPVRYLGIETFNPSGVTFPPEVKSVLIVNNAVAQPEVPLESSLPGRKDALNLSADSAVFDFCRTLGMEIAATPYFEDIRLLEEAYRDDAYYFTDRMLAPENISVLCREHQVDAVISLDQLLFRIKESLQHSFIFDLRGRMEIGIAGMVRTYLPGQNTPLSSIAVSDTLVVPFEYDVLNPSPVKDLPDLALRETARMVAERCVVNYVPYWSNDVRWYYVSSNAQWKEAAAYAATDRWEQALPVWKAVYDKTADASWKNKSRLASNLALSHELLSDYEKALYWATISYDLLAGRSAENDKYLQLQKLYTDVLKHRVVADKRLIRQISE